MKPYLICAVLILATSCARAARTTRRRERPGQRRHGHATREFREVRLSAETQKKWGIVVGRATKESVSTTLTCRRPGPQPGAHRPHLLAARSKVISVARISGPGEEGQVLLVVHSPAFAQAKTAFLRRAPG